MFADYVQFFDRYLAPRFPRIQGGWCPEWTEHPEAKIAVGALWRAWEEARRQDRDGGLTAGWLMQYAYPIMDRLSSDGTFAGCTPAGHAPAEPMKDEFEDWETFYDQALRAWYARPLDSGTWAWCKDWRQHPGARKRVQDLHMAYEACRRQKGVGPAQWWAQYADPIMGHALDPAAEMIGCVGVHTPPSDLP